MGFFQRKPRCPTCSVVLEAKPLRKHQCPHCGKFILVRNGELVAEEQAAIIDWLARLGAFGVSRKDFDKHRNELSHQFGVQASVNDVLWRILNKLVLDHAMDDTSLELVYREMAGLAASEGKDPTQYLVQADEVRRHEQKPTTLQKQVFLGQDELAYVRKLRKEDDLDQAEKLLMSAEPSPAVLDELRKSASTRARAARENGDWRAVVRHLEGYTMYANKSREYCIKMVNQEPPAHTESDSRLLQEAKERLTD